MNESRPNSKGKKESHVLAWIKITHYLAIVGINWWRMNKQDLGHFPGILFTGYNGVLDYKVRMPIKCEVYRSPFVQVQSISPFQPK
jgi:hypothetical protein